jgi:hypothetical protein
MDTHKLDIRTMELHLNSPFIFMVRCLTKPRDNLVFYLYTDNMVISDVDCFLKKVSRLILYHFFVVLRNF